jgi:hypothetical protein
MKNITETSMTDERVIFFNQLCVDFEFNVCHDLGDNDQPVMWLNEFEDRSVGIFGGQVSPVFYDYKSLIEWTWTHKGKFDKVVELLNKQWGGEFPKDFMWEDWLK